ncbi:hypothetical protein Tco_1522536, partial [Tanacetum coccineum]
DLEQDITKEEVKRAVWDCGVDKSPGPDGFSFYFYRHFWSMIEDDVFGAVEYFFINGDIPNGCNSNFIALIPKIIDANMVKDFRPISLIGSLYKIIAKLLANRLVGVPNKIMGVNVEDAKVKIAANKLGCLVLKTPFTYLGTKVGENMHRKHAWNEVVEKVLSRLSRWKLKTLSIGGRFTLLKVVVQVVVAVLFSKRFVMDQSDKALYGEDGSLDKVGASAARTCWTTILQEVKVIQAQGINIHDFIKLKLGNGEDSRFWLDKWYEGGVLKRLFPRVYALELDKNISTQFDSMAEIMKTISLVPRVDRERVCRQGGSNPGPIKVKILDWN